MSQGKTFVINGSGGGCMAPLGTPGKVIVPEFPFMQPTLIMPNAPWEPLRILPPIPPPAPIPPVVIPAFSSYAGVAPMPGWQASTPCPQQNEWSSVYPGCSCSM